MPFRPGHLTNGHLDSMQRNHDSCVICAMPFVGPPNQVLCGKCKNTPEGQKFRAERKERNMRAFLLRRKLGIAGTYK